MMDKLRVFIGLELPQELKEAIAKVKVELDDVIKGRWITTPNLHLTLKFIGLETKENIEKISQVLEQIAAKTPTFILRTTNFGFFPNVKNPRIFWLGLTNQSLNKLVAKIDEELEQLGYQREKRGFQPHVTLVRFKKPLTLPSDIEKKLPSVNISFKVKEIVLFQSILKPSGAEYLVYKKFTLRGM